MAIRWILDSEFFNENEEYIEIFYMKNKEMFTGEAQTYYRLYQEDIYHRGVSFEAVVAKRDMSKDSNAIIPKEEVVSMDSSVLSKKSISRICTSRFVPSTQYTSSSSACILSSQKPMIRVSIIESDTNTDSGVQTGTVYQAAGGRAVARVNSP